MATHIRNRQISAPSPRSPEQGEVVRLEPHDDPASVAGRLAGIARIEINFPKFGDGRG